MFNQMEIVLENTKALVYIIEIYLIMKYFMQIKNV